ncbi:amino acid adenylation domain [Leptospira ryugenii]|uniref:Amino acid adenylation domain n=1 Tax=Leptospira ryugenii TaxID=1917863 RepID=A0A2P2E1K5_9LEPT|nr:hypothetical protein [Leptospira ryugenii]GBF50744.1 amino acid adenylation domain [Leptospira ryugenii]
MRFFGFQFLICAVTVGLSACWFPELVPDRDCALPCKYYTQRLKVLALQEEYDLKLRIWEYHLGMILQGR